MTTRDRLNTFLRNAMAASRLPFDNKVWAVDQGYFRDVLVNQEESADLPSVVHSYLTSVDADVHRGGSLRLADLFTVQVRGEIDTIDLIESQMNWLAAMSNGHFTISSKDDDGQLDTEDTADFYWQIYTVRVRSMPGPIPVRRIEDTEVLWGPDSDPTEILWGPASDPTEIQF